MIERIGNTYITSNIEGGEYSYVLEAGSKAKLEQLVGRSVNHFKLDIRFEDGEYVVLVETKQNFVDADEKQLAEYLEEERALHTGKKVICILANTNNDKIKVWKSFVDDEHSVLSTFVQKRPFYSGRDLYLLLPKTNMSLKTKMFICTVLSANQYRYSYGRQANKTLPYLILKLPILRDINKNPVIDETHMYSKKGYIPDWEWMESYINSFPYSDRI